MNNRYMDWSDGPGIEEETSDQPAFKENVVVMPTPHEDSWHAVWAYDDHNGHAEFFGEKEEVIAWARSKSAAVVRVWSDELQDLELLPTTS
jgi:hypothetical protein